MTKNTQRASLVGLIVAAAAARLLPHPANVTPIAAMALLGGAYLDTAAAYALPLVALFLGDLFLGLHATMPFVYGGFVLTTFLGTRLRASKTSGRVLGACLAGSGAFFLLTNFGVWLTAGLYPMTPAGLAACYAAALPFLRNSLLGDVFFTGVLFGLGALIEKSGVRSAAPAAARPI